MEREPWANNVAIDLWDCVVAMQRRDRAKETGSNNDDDTIIHRTK